MPRTRPADTWRMHLFPNSLNVFDEGLGRLRTVEYALTGASPKSRILHAVLETDEKTLCGRDFDVELTDYRKPGDPGGDEPNCRPCRKALRARAASLQGKDRRELPRMGCRHCGSVNFRQAIRRREVDRCSIRVDENGKLHYDLDEAPRTRVESIEVTCAGCRRAMTDKDLVRAIYAPRPSARRRLKRRAKNAAGATV